MIGSMLMGPLTGLFTGSLTGAALLAQEGSGPGPVRLGRHSESAQEAYGGPLEAFFFGLGGTTEGAQEVDALFMMIWWIGVFFFVLLMGLMIYWAFFKYRRRPGVPPPVSPSHNTFLEVFWTVVPSSTLIVIFLFGLFTYLDRNVASTQALKIDVSGWKWGWELTYPGGQQSPWLTTIDERTRPDGSVAKQTQQVKIYVLPADTEIDLRMISQDVIHSFWLPDFRIKMDLYPNRYTGYSFRTPKLGSDEEYRDHWLFCAEYCGDYHSEMAGIIRVVPRSAYDGWLTQIESSGDPIDVGKLVHQSKCAVCHSVDGSQNTGPTWLNAYGYPVDFQDGASMEARDDNYIRESILNPGAKIVAGYPNQMPSFDGQLSETQLRGVIEYYKSLSDKYTPPDPEAEESAEGEGDDEGDAESGSESGDGTDATEQSGGDAGGMNP